ncbi:hypothetical protein GS429_04075 [Natronorubrum sp. JWXQ-INN-674]|uniref:SPW repeat-containing integral membrane domain-containing protein n=1 Tax=Natronorubrum halalkaliphilum TaxID=2691917 RepID=A0A6B0VKD8_9EURY|nr:DMT family transporter [Natronorubrum halalkaliphilum]MXV61252.1 hypothetical protein [Natronorubrum halalkaliphilum]
MSDSNRDDRDPQTAGGTEVGTGREDRVRKPSDDVDSGTGVGDRPGDRDPRDESTAIADEERRRKTSVLSIIVAALGVWVAASLLLFDVAEASLWNNLLVGAAVFLAAGYNFYRLSNDIPLSTGVASLVAVLGIWLIIAPALLQMTEGLFWTTLVSGLLIAGLAGYNAYEAREARSVATESTRA